MAARPFDHLEAVRALADSTPPLVGAAGWPVRNDRHTSWVLPSEGGCADTAATETPIKPPTSADSELVE